MRLKLGVRVNGVRPETIVGMVIVDGVIKDLSNTGAVITSCREGTHKGNSKHYVGFAFDVRLPVGVSATERAGHIIDAFGLSGEPGEEWDEVAEADHVHCELDPEGQIK